MNLCDKMVVKCLLFLFCLTALCFQLGRAQIESFSLDLGDLYRMQKGIGWPHSLHVVEGHEALMKLENTVPNQQSCVVTTPGGTSFDVRHPPNKRFESWSECGIRLKNVEKQDYGRWRITSSKGDNSLTGWVELYIEEYINQYTGSPITLQDGHTLTEVDLSTLPNSYCLVAQPFTESSLVPGHCSVTLERTTRAVQGNWHVLLGLPGRVAELPVDRAVTVESERLDVGFVRETNPNKLHIYCNIQHTAKNITFCRFQKTTAQSGYNVIDGLSDGSHSYYGDGFAKRHCGMTIESPTPNDDGTWKCTVGVQEWVGTRIEPKTPLQALIRVVTSTSARNSDGVERGMRLLNEEDRTIFVQRDMSFTIPCRAEVSLAYCWFQHPNGTQFTPMPQTDINQQFWYEGENLQSGACGITFTHATENDYGQWTCHMGPRDEVGVEYTDTVTVRVTGPLAARKTEVSSVVGGNATLYCHSSNGNRPLQYCRFLSPTFLGISVDSRVTRQNAILNRFYFTPGRDLDHGDCSLIIDPVHKEDLGIWTCAAMVDQETLEAKDTIMLYVEDAPTFLAGIIGMSIGAFLLLGVLIGVVFYKYRSKIPIPWRRTTTVSNTNIVNDSVSFRTESTHDQTSARSSTSSRSNEPDNVRQTEDQRTQINFSI